MPGPMLGWNVDVHEGCRAVAVRAGHVLLDGELVVDDLAADAPKLEQDRRVRLLGERVALPGRQGLDDLVVDLAPGVDERGAGVDGGLRRRNLHLENGGPSSLGLRSVTQHLLAANLERQQVNGPVEWIGHLVVGHRSSVEVAVHIAPEERVGRWVRQGEVESELVALQSLLLDDGVEERRRSLGSRVGEGEAEDALEGQALEDGPVGLVDQAEGLVVHGEGADVQVVDAHRAIERAGAKLHVQVHGRLGFAVCLRQGVVVAVTLLVGASTRGAQIRGHPQVRAAGIEDDEDLCLFLSVAGLGL